MNALFKDVTFMFFFLLLYLVPTLSEVQAAMQMSQSWEESLSLVTTTHTHTHSHGYQCFADRLGGLEAAIPPLSMLWPQCRQRPLGVCGEGEHKHARLTLWELTGPPVSEGQTAPVV